MEDFPVCQHAYPDVRSYQQGFEQFSRPYTPLMDITGSIFGGLTQDSRLRSAYEPGMLSRSVNSVSERAFRVGARGQDCRFSGAGMNNGSLPYSNHASDIRTFHRSLSLSSPNIEVGFLLDPATGPPRESIENNSNVINRSQSFADRIMEQFSIVEREHNRLAERIQRSQSIYEQIQRNGVEFEGLFSNLSSRMQRRHTQRDRSGDYERRLRSPVASGSVSECGRAVQLNHRLLSEGDALSCAHSVGGDGSFLTADEEENYEEDDDDDDEDEDEDDDEDDDDDEDEDDDDDDEDEEEQHADGRQQSDRDEETEDVEFSLLNDREISEILSRRNADIMSRSLIIEREEIFVEEESDYEDHPDSENSGNGQALYAGCGNGGDGDYDNYGYRYGYRYGHERDGGGATRRGSHRDEEEDEDEDVYEDGPEYDVNDSSNIRGLISQIRERVSQRIDGGAVMGVPDNIQNSLPVSRFDLSKSQNLENDKKMCLICLEEFKDRQEIRWLPCTHCFCRECITSWFHRGTVCPICKDDVVDHFR